MNTLGSMPLREKRDALLARQRARQLAGLLGFDFFEQAAIAAGAFAVAWQIVEHRIAARLCFFLDDSTLRIQTELDRPSQRRAPPQLLRLERKLPNTESRLSLEDLRWSLEQLSKITPNQLYEEIERQNQELLTTLHALARVQEAGRNQEAVGSGHEAGIRDQESPAA